ncbi:MAG: hypothetical protein IAX21_03410 [Candidatus Bathyarchaeota archaeon]|nr:MAG: hypothetical protein IAX21_03410 [Candidatus Bathyarchaeota archaeon]
MGVKNVGFKFNLHTIHSSGRRKVLLFVFLLFIIVLVFSCLFLVFNGAFPFMTKTPETSITTTSEAELEEAVNNAVGPTVITLDGDIELTEALIIPAGKEITLTSSNIENGFYKLIGANNQSAIIVETDGVLRLDGVVVTHEKGVYGSGVFADFGSALILYSGVICNNTMPKDYMTPNGEWGGGVVNLGTFSMIGGEISSNTAYIGGGGVLNYGTFEMTGGKISGNTVSIGSGEESVSGFYGCGYGGGVFNALNFSMSGGEISGNTAEAGGGVFNRWNTFSLDGGVICDNTASVGGGVHNFYGTVSMSGGVISDNVAWDKGGGVLNYFMWSTFNMSEGVISNNKAGNLGGGVCSDYEFNMSGGVISGNTANYGGGVYVGNGSFNSAGGKFSGNTASQSGNDVYYQK